MDATSAIALVVALGGWILAAVTAWINYRAQTAATFFQALDWMPGGTQKRSIGIAAIEGAWHNRRFRHLNTPPVKGRHGPHPHADHDHGRGVAVEHLAD